ncbi:amidohydrolase [Sphingomonas quercus]|uniref:Amidohydrolase family protein n=1 Tax=Sphingomonas quercus TaxID=2842451 RepID=A0ABS6BKS6_9SPHN|nr:amidohydrolase [Sphingomonas quercus]MBU3078447.1 amidohydrolase family protein [Sphingomonas quercus]
MRLRMGGTLAAALLLTLAPPAFADGLIDNVDGVTLDGNGIVRRFSGIVITPEGRVAKLLDKGDKRPDELDFRLDGKGQHLIPGLIDAHGHFMELGFFALRLQLFDTNSLAEAQGRLAAYAAEHPRPIWVQGGGWNQERWGLGRFPTAADLDQVVKDRPVVLGRVDGHALWANSAAIAAAGITAATKDPPGGRIIRDAKGNPTGVFVDAAQALLNKAVPEPTPVELDRAFAKAQEILLSSGLTAVADMGTTLADWQVMRRAGDAGRLDVRILSYGSGVETALAVAGTGPTPWLYDGRLKMVGVKLYADGALGSRGAYLKAPYADAPGERGLGFNSDAQLKNLMSRAAMDGFQVAVHAIGDAANAQVLDAIDQLAETYKGDRRWRIEHAQIVDVADLPRFGRNGVIASMQPTHETSDWRMAEARLGPARLEGAYAWATMLKLGSPLAFGSDFPVESPNPFPGLAAAISREDEKGEPAGGWRPQEKVTIAQALAGFTTMAAHAGFAEDRLGSLEPGHMADFLLVDRDVMVVPAKELRETKVLETWIGGRRAWVRK